MPSYDLLIRGGLLLDGSGSAPISADIGIAGGRIAAIGDIGDDATAADQIDAAGLTVCPGFIDVHTHSDLTLLLDGRGESKVYQGVTTEVVGNCSFSAVPVGPNPALHSDHLASLGQDPLPPTWTDLDEYRERAERQGVAINVAMQIGNGTLRIATLGLDARPATPTELQEMERLLDLALEQGAFGLSTGLTYPPSMYAPTEELVALSRVVARHGGHYATHARVSVGNPLGAIDEAARIGRESGARVQFSHVAINDPDRWGQHGEHLARFEEHRAAGVDIAYDVYPYAASSSNLTQYLPAWVQEGGTASMADRLADRATRERARADVARGWYGGIRWLWDRVVIGIDPLEPSNAGKTLQALAEAHAIAPEELTLRLCETRGNAITVVLFYRTEEDIQAFLRHPLSTVGSDGLAYPVDLGDARPHPRSFGTHPRVLGRYVRELGTLALADAVHKMTGRAAERMGIQDRGLLREGLAADVVVFDPATVSDRATFERPAQTPVGIHDVIVNGEIVVRDGRQTSARPGRVLRRGDRSQAVADIR